MKKIRENDVADNKKYVYIYIVLELKVRFYLLATQYSMLMAGFQQCFRGNLG